MNDSISESTNSQDTSRKSKSSKSSKNVYSIVGHNGASIVDTIMQNLGWTKAADKNTEDFKFKWTELVSNINYKKFREGEQLVNHIPNCGLITNKLGLLMSLRNYDRSLKDTNRNKTMDINQFMPETYIIDDVREREAFFSVYKEGEIWINKATGLNQGKGISLIRDIDEFKKELDDRDNVSRSTLSGVKARIVQRYIANPLLLKERKFDIRSFLCIASTAPYLVLYCPGYIRLSMNRYSNEDLDLITHLTNQFIQKKSPLYQEVKEDTIWSMKQFNTYLNDTYDGNLPTYKHDWAKNVLEKQMQQIMLIVFQSVKNKFASRVGFFELYGFDFMVDEDFKVWLIEVNVNPALHINCNLLKEILPPMIEEVVLIALECFDKIVNQKRNQLLPLDNLKRFIVIYTESNTACRNRISSFSSLSTWIPPRYRYRSSSSQSPQSYSHRNSSSTGNQGDDRANTSTDYLVGNNRKGSVSQNNIKPSNTQFKFESSLRNYKPLPKPTTDQSNEQQQQSPQRFQRSKSLYPITTQKELTKSITNQNSNTRLISNEQTSKSISTSSIPATINKQPIKTNYERSRTNINFQSLTLDQSKLPAQKIDNNNNKQKESLSGDNSARNNNGGVNSVNRNNKVTTPKQNNNNEKVNKNNSMNGSSSTKVSNSTSSSATNHVSQPIKTREPAPISLVQVVTGKKNPNPYQQQINDSQNNSRQGTSNKMKSQVSIKRRPKIYDRSS